MGNVINYILAFFSNQTGNVAQREVAVSKEPGLNNVRTRMQACMILSGVGDAIGYNDGKWEFCPSGRRIQEELQSFGGLTKLKPNKQCMIVSDDTVMHMATADALLASYNDVDKQYCELAREYRKCMGDMRGRSPGLTCMAMTKQLYPDSGRYVTPFNPRGGGCGAAMRAVPIGLLYHRPDERNNLVRVGIESGRMTHNHPTGFLGSMTVALFVSYAIQGKDVREWGEGLLRTLPIAKQYCEEQKRDWELIKENWSYFEESWKKYVNEIISADFGDISADEFDKFVRSVSFMGTGGASGHDAPMIAYDAILRCYHGPEDSRWERLCRYGMFHGGDSDSTGIIAGACYGAMYGLEGVPLNNHTQLEYRDRLERLGGRLYDKSESIKMTVSLECDETADPVKTKPHQDIPLNNDEVITKEVSADVIGKEHETTVDGATENFGTSNTSDSYYQ
ncbi:Protein ADP-ribosylarginine hydrolase-like [Oopsacas minuta]|uniref:ADP-ribosylhydrolase ARH1 n=1 Tax=Oopsacas minuta TaxID=111878 RepID=A0AAV7KHQ0_9METZ|nr:Protein ADP-ribosylarginine hydrolase-like [Oopsacas minuta]